MYVIHQPCNKRETQGRKHMRRALKRRREAHCAQPSANASRNGILLALQLDTQLDLQPLSPGLLRFLFLLLLLQLLLQLPNLPLSLILVFLQLLHLLLLRLETGDGARFAPTGGPGIGGGCLRAMASRSMHAMHGLAPLDCNCIFLESLQFHCFRYVLREFGVVDC